MPDAPTLSYDDWLAEFARLARANELEWLIPCDPTARRPGYAAGLTPEEELAALKDMAEWRGCGCGG